MQILLFLIFFILGTAFGSFFNVLIYRLHQKKGGIFWGRSFCPKCQHLLKAADLIPIFSYLFLKRRCRYCQKKIPSHYPLVEFLTGLLFVLIFLKFGISQPFLLVLFLIYGGILVLTFFYDLLYLEIPDQVLLPGILLAFLASFHPQTPRPEEALLGASILLIFFGLQILISKGRWLGGGDLRIGAFMGLILGWKLAITALILSYLIGSLFSLYLLAFKKATIKTKIPLGPFLVSGTVLTIFFGPEILNWYLSLMGI